MYVLSPICIPVRGDSIAKGLNWASVSIQLKAVMALLGFKKYIIYVGCPPAMEVVRGLRREKLIYERTDLFGEMPGADKNYIDSLDDELTRTSDLVLYVNEAMWKQGLTKNRNSILIGHGVDFARFVEAEQSQYIPEDITRIVKPIVGFFGDISTEACDFALIERAAEALPDISLVLIGPVSSDVSSLRRHSNIFFLGQKPYEEIPHYGKTFDVAIMPWRKNRWIEFCNPVKTKEYLALGKPIVSIDYPELKPYHDVVYRACNYDEFIEAIHKALREDDPTLKQRRQEKVINETWDNKVRRIIDFIEGN
jgi:glycosyltransferase involved in cell wall biosynthesis